MSHSSNKTFDLQATDNSIYSFCCQLLKHFQELYIKSKKLRSLAKFCEPHFTRQQTNYEAEISSNPAMPQFGIIAARMNHL